VALSLTAVSGGADRSRPARQRDDRRLEIDDPAALAAITELTASQLLKGLPGERSRVALTDAGQARYRQIRTAIDEITARLYGDLPADDLAAASRVLTVITAGPTPNWPAASRSATRRAVRCTLQPNRWCSNAHSQGGGMVAHPVNRSIMAAVRSNSFRANEGM
jgi:hypothetical protein